MAFAPLNTKSKLRLLSASRPDYKDFSGPPNGDYVRYVDQLMRWAEQEQERARLRSAGEKARGMTDAQWGRSPSAGGNGGASSMAQPGSVDSSLERLKRKAQAKAAQLQQQAAANATARPASASKPAGAGKSTPLNGIIVFIGFVLAAVFKPSLIPVVIIGWVIFNIVRTVRAASRNGKS